MDVMDFIRDKFSQDCSIGTVLNLVIKEFGLSEKDAQKEIDDYFKIIEEIDRARNEQSK